MSCIVNLSKAGPYHLCVVTSIKMLPSTRGGLKVLLNKIGMIMFQLHSNTIFVSNPSENVHILLARIKKLDSVRGVCISGHHWQTLLTGANFHPRFPSITIWT